jgi:hypothetical protein
MDKKNLMGMDRIRIKKIFNGYGYENTFIRTLSYPLTALSPVLEKPDPYH